MDHKPLVLYVIWPLDQRQLHLEHSTQSCVMILSLGDQGHNEDKSRANLPPATATFSMDSLSIDAIKSDQLEVQENIISHLLYKKWQSPREIQTEKKTRPQLERPCQST